MKKIILIIILLSKIIYAEATSVNSDTLVEENGWLVYFVDDAVWVPANITEATADTIFFQQKEQYQNCISVTSWIGIFAKKKIATKHLVFIASEFDSVTKEPIYADARYIYLIPIKVTFKVLPGYNHTVMGNILFKNGIYFNSIFYYLGGNRLITKLEPLRKKDKRKWKRLKR